MDGEEVWIQKPLDLLRRLALLPSEKDNFSKRFNTLTRLLIVTCVVLAVAKYKHWRVILIAGLLILLHSYLSRDERSRVETKMKTSAKNNPGFEKMTDRPVTSFYTVERIVDNDRGVSLQQIATAPRQQATGEVITITPRVVTQGARTKKPAIMMPKTEPQLRLKTKAGGKLAIVIPTTKKDQQPDFMRLAFEELEDGSIADQDSKNMDSLLL
jgi:hypothetical protein